MNFSFQAHISSMPGYEILSTNEKKLCANLRLTPAHYISYKTCLLTNHLQKKKGQTPKPLNPSGLDKNNRKIIFNFLMRAGWITAYWKIHATKKRKNSFAFYFLSVLNVPTASGILDIHIVELFTYYLWFYFRRLYNL